RRGLSDCWSLISSAFATLVSAYPSEIYHPWFLSYRESAPIRIGDSLITRIPTMKPLNKALS
ncbi:MAG: hypothetical protein ABI443_00815, partial [Chthoniobacterales bacterium]